jgi:DNA-binding Xre family transcriptional regulator
MEIQEALLNYISENGIKQKTIAQKTFISESRLSRILNSKKCIMRANEYAAICKALNLPYDFFEENQPA